ncbi:MAG: Lpg1974 family pore-forming outer membrane protein [Simkaniaceae bacterium]
MKKMIAPFILSSFALWADAIPLDNIYSLKEELNKDEQEIARIKEELHSLQEKRKELITTLSRAAIEKQRNIKSLEEKILGQSICTPCKAPEPQVEESLECLPLIFSYRPELHESAFTLRGELLYWTAEEGALIYALQNVPSTPLNQFQGLVGNLERTPFDWNPGVRVAAGYRFCPKYWEVEGQYTYIKIDGSTHISAPSEALKYLTPTWGRGGNFFTTQAPSTIELTTQIADLYLAKRFLLDDNLLFRLMMGLTGSWIDQEWKFNYYGLNNAAAKYNSEWAFSGGGMRLGLDIDWYIGKGFSLFGKATVASLIGFYKNNIEGINQFNQNDLSPVKVQDSHYNDQRLAYNTQFLMGPMWGKMISFWGIEVFAGYELNTWFNIQEQYLETEENASFQNLFQSKRTIINRGQLGFQGFSGYIKLIF